MNWIRLNCDLPGSTRILQLARALRKDEVYALGAACTWFCWLDKNSVDGETGLTPKELDAMALHIKGMAAALLENGWAVLKDGYVVAVDFSKYNGESSKQRALTARRVEKARKNVTPQALQDAEECNGESVTRGVTDALATRQYTTDNNIHTSNTTVVKGAEAGTGVVCGDDFRRFFCAVARCHPVTQTWKQDAPLPADVTSAARDAFERFAGVEDDAETLAALRAYMADRLAEDSRRVAFFRPRLLRVFFERLDGVLEDCRRWKRETRWKPKKAAKPDPADNPAPQDEEMTEEERLAYFHSLKEDDMLKVKGGNA